MKFRTLRRIAKQVPRQLRRRDFDLTDATMEAEPGPPPEAVFDRLTGPWGSRRLDEET